MNRYERYIFLTAEIINLYDGAEPFSNHIKKFFTAHRQLGSRDRKQISACCYAYFRTGQLLSGIELSKSIPRALFLCSNHSEPILSALFPELNKNIGLSFHEKCAIIGIDWDEYHIFPWTDALSKEVEISAFVWSHIWQPDLFIRIRPGKKDLVEQKLKQASVKYSLLNNHCISLPNGTDISKTVILNNEVVVQDYSSQQLADLFPSLEFSPDQRIDVWDCCAASGGKAILCKDYYPNASITVSDIRSSILHNLSIRLKEAGIACENIISADLTQKLPKDINEKKFDLILADVPCTGSGTWSRSPEWLRFFKKEKIEEYVSLQQRILHQVIPQVKKGGYVLYSTCSVFSAENEAQVQYIMQQFNLKLICQQIIKGYQHKADTMFGALLKKE